MSDEILFDITFNIGSLNVGTWRRYLQVPTPENLFLVLVEVVEAWGLERDPGQVESYRTLSQEERVFVQKSFGLAMVRWTNEQEAKKHKKKKKPKLRRKKRTKGD